MGVRILEGELYTSSKGAVLETKAVLIDSAERPLNLPMFAGTEEAESFLAYLGQDPGSLSDIVLDAHYSHWRRSQQETAPTEPAPESP
jgi:hypothetical protein